MSWGGGYVTELGYTHGYYQELMPSRLSFACLSQGISAPGLDAKPLRILELGCGQGFSANLIAAANPEWQYVAADFNPAHIAGARELASASGFDNVLFREDSFSDIANDPSYGTFDVISLHGIYTWVSAQNRSHIVEIARKLLNPGGILYVSYNCYPGWSHFHPLRRLFTDRNLSSPEAAATQRLQGGFDLYEKLEKAGSNYLKATPGLPERIAKMKSLQKNYLAHEYLNDEWNIFFSSDVIRDMERAKLTFVASANLVDNADDLNLTESQRSLLAEITSVGERQWLKDLMVNQQFRRDVFVKGVVRPGLLTAQDTWSNLRFVLSKPASATPKKLTTALGEMQLRSDVYGPLIDSISQGPKRFGDILSECRDGSLNWRSLPTALNILLGIGACHLAVDEARQERAVKTCASINRVILNRAREADELMAVSSPVIGGGVMLDQLSQLFVLAHLSQAPDRISFVKDALKVRDRRLMRDGAVLTSDDENNRELLARSQQFEAEQLSTLEMLGIA